MIHSTYSKIYMLCDTINNNTTRLSSKKWDSPMNKQIKARYQEQGQEQQQQHNMI